MLKVLFIREMNKELQDYFRENLVSYEIQLIFPDEDTDENRLKELAKDADVLIGWRPSMELLKAAENATAFINPGVGVKRHIQPFRELNESRSTPLKLINGHGNAYFTAEHAVAMLHAIYNKIVAYHNNMVSGAWRDNDPGSSMSLRHKKVGLLGYGAINQYVHQFLAGYDVEFSILKRSWSSNEIKNVKQFRPDQLHEFLTDLDVLILALPHTKQTEGMIGTEEFELMKQNMVIINVARGVIIEEEAFYNALKDKKITAAGIDVWYNYSPDEDENGAKYPTDYKFHELDNVLLSPHRAASPFDNLERWDEQIENLKRLAQGKEDLLNIVDLDLEY